MQVRVLLFGILKDIAGRSEERLDLADNARVSDILEHYKARVPRFEQYVAALATSVNQSFAPRDAELHDGDEVGLLPPVSGGKSRANPALVKSPETEARCGLTNAAIDARSIIDSIKQPADGSMVIFDGVVRDNSRGRRTLFLDYDAYEPMALRELQKLTEEALRRFDIRDVRIVHRLGRLEIGETSVLIVVASAHRAAAFDACRWLIDTLKCTVPIWKKEHFADGAVWSNGEPFPADVASGVPRSSN
jgi:molybdopterin synthase catalytic subunit/molybdopterin converting factor small subunit